jgi:prostaglandin-H2 D-isomerase / glutathione transferase
MLEIKFFDIPGRADAVRTLLHAANVSWKDTRISMEDWPSVKPLTPLGCVPTLTVDGTEFCQTVSMQRYTASLVGLYPKDDPLKALIVDEMMESINECMDKCPFTGTEEEKKASQQEFQKKVMTPYFNLIESRIQKFGRDNTVCGTFTVADLVLLACVDFLKSGRFVEYIDLDFFKDYPGITACVENAADHEIVKSYKASVDKK